MAFIKKKSYKTSDIFDNIHQLLTVVEIKTIKKKMMKIIVLCSLIALCIAEAPFAGYQASGWKPEGAAFNLPKKYGAPPQQQQENPQEVEVRN